MEYLQKAMDDMNTMMTRMNSTLDNLAPQASSVADLADLLGMVLDLQKAMTEVGDHLQSVSVGMKRLESGDHSSGSSNQSYRQTFREPKHKGGAEEHPRLASFRGLWTSCTRGGWPCSMKQE